MTHQVFIQDKTRIKVKEFFVAFILSKPQKKKLEKVAPN